MTADEGARVSFDAHDAATPASAWDADPRWQGLPALALPTGRTVVVAAHPDDETLGAGGLLAELAARGVPAEVVVLSDGAASHPGSPTLSPEELAARRRDEVLAAVALLAPGARVTLLAHPDGGLREARSAVERDLRRVLDAGPRVDALVVPWRGDGHRDHRVAGEVGAALAAERGARLLEYPLWMWHWATPDDERVPWDRLRVVDLDAASVVRRLRAVAAHRSQVHALSPDPRDTAVLGPDLLAALDRDVAVVVADDAPASTLDGTYFDATYARRDDPWGFEDRWYEERKRAVTLAALPDARYGRVLEVGCSIGVLTAQLAGRCDALLAVDVASAAVARARDRLAGAPHVRVEVADVAAGVPDGPWDLVVLSEVGYYLSRADLVRTAAALRRSLAPGGTVLAVHWRHPVADYPLGGDEVHRVLARVLGLTRLVRHEEADLVLDVLADDPRSVARRTGLL